MTLGSFDLNTILAFSVSLQFLAKHPNEVIIRKVADNRRDQEQVVQNFTQPCSAQLCEGVVYIESIIT